MITAKRQNPRTRARMRPKISIIPAIIVICCLAISCPGEGNKSMDDRQEERDLLIDKTVVARGIEDEAVISAMREVRRHLFVPEKYRREAYMDSPLPIGHNQTISQPYIVALMTSLADIDSSSRVLEIGTGSGYQAAVLGEIADSVFTIEIVPELAERAENILDSLGYDNVYVRAGDGYKGWPEHAPFDAVVVTAAPDHVPEPLVEQLAEGGELVIPVGSRYQQLKLLRKSGGELVEKDIIPVRFVPMTGEAEEE